MRRRAGLRARRACSASGLTSCAEKSATPRKTSSAPRPMKARIDPVPLAPKSPKASARKPSPARVAEPMPRKRANRPGGITAPSRTAAIGGTRVARRAGRMLATIVTTMPTTRQTMTVRGLKSRPVFGSVKPELLEDPEQELREPEPEEEPDHRRKRPDQERLEQDRAQDLAPRRADRPQRRELARPLRDRDRQRVRDHEGADEERNPAEREQECLQEAGEAFVSLASVSA